MRPLLLTACAWLAGCVTVAPTLAQAQPAILDTGWSEAVITTADAARWEHLLVEVGQWEVREQAELGPGLKRFWGLAPNTKGAQILLSNQRVERGFIRLVELPTATTPLIRADDRPWDTGAHFDINIRVRDLPALHHELQRLGWHGDAEPSQFTFGPFEVIEWIARGPDGVRIAFSERLAPALEGYPNLKRFSRAFNSTQTVADMPAALAFYRDVLGMKVYLEHRGASADAGPNVLGLPFETTALVAREVFILHPDKINDGSVELLAFDGATGRDLSSRGAPSNLGLSVLRFPVSDLDSTLNRLSSASVELSARPRPIWMPPYGCVKAAAISSPEGARLELFEPTPLAGKDQPLSC